MTDLATPPPSTAAPGDEGGSADIWLRVFDVAIWAMVAYLGLVVFDWIFGLPFGLPLDLGPAVFILSVLIVVKAAIKAPERSFWRDVEFLKTTAQVVAVVAVLLIIGILQGNLIANLEAAGIETNFDYLDQPTNFDIGYSSFEPAQPIREALFVGIKNTFASAIIGIIFCTIIGVIVGVARLSGNWLARKMATIYVETIRNIPPLLLIILVMQAVILPLPLIKEASTPFDLLVISNKEVGVPSLASRDNSGIFLIIFAFAAVVGIAVVVWRTHKFNQTGVHHHRVLWGGGVFLLIAGLGYWALGGPFALSRPELGVIGQTSVMIGGIRMSAAYVAITFALTIYTASHVAEIVRGSIQAVPHGQTEAAQSVALSSFQRLRYIVLPQAFRIATPPTINQYLNLVKNTSLGIAVGYAEITLITKTVIGNANPAPQNIIVLMACYLLFSLTISLIVNILNRRLQLKTN